SWPAIGVRLRATRWFTIALTKSWKLIALDHGNRRRAGDGLGNGARARTFIPIFSADAVAGNERRWESTRSFQAAARQFRICHARRRNGGSDFRDLRFPSKARGTTLFLRCDGCAV